MTFTVFEILTTTATDPVSVSSVHYFNLMFSIVIYCSAVGFGFGCLIGLFRSRYR